MAMVRIFLLMAALHSANVALAETEVKGRPALVLDGELLGRRRQPAARVVVDLLGGTTGNRAKAIEAAAGAVERTNADLEMEVDALFIE